MLHHAMDVYCVQETASRPNFKNKVYVQFAICSSGYLWKTCNASWHASSHTLVHNSNKNRSLLRFYIHITKVKCTKILVISFHRLNSFKCLYAKKLIWNAIWIYMVLSFRFLFYDFTTYQNHIITGCKKSIWLLSVIVLYIPKNKTSCKRACFCNAIKCRFE